VNRPWLYRGYIHHARQGKAANAFRYPGLFLCFPLAQREQMRSRLFGYNRFSLFGYHDADHGDRSPDPEAWVRGLLRREGLEQADGDIWLQAMPRILGFVFNPVSFWYCHDRDGQLRVVLCEVNNTFGERHCYLVSRPDHGVIDADCELVCDKVFHVSPFFEVRGEYRFRFLSKGVQRTVAIDYYQDQALVLRTSVSGQASALSDSQLLRSFFSLGWATLMVVLRIHWQALRLWLKGATFFSKPEPPHKEISS
jgi:DUF1365 family protein